MRRPCLPSTHWPTSPDRSRSAASATHGGSASGCERHQLLPELDSREPRDSHAANRASSSQRPWTTPATRSRSSARLYLAEPAEHRRGHRGAGRLRSSRCSSSATTRASRELVHDLLPSFDVDDLPTGAVVALEYAAADDWADVEHAVSRLTYYDFPKNSREPVYDSLSGPRCRARSSKRRVRLSGLPGVGGMIGPTRRALLGCHAASLDRLRALDIGRRSFRRRTAPRGNGGDRDVALGRARQRRAAARRQP